MCFWRKWKRSKINNMHIHIHTHTHRYVNTYTYVFICVVIYIYIECSTHSHTEWVDDFFFPPTRHYSRLYCSVLHTSASHNSLDVCSWLITSFSQPHIRSHNSQWRIPYLEASVISSKTSLSCNMIIDTATLETSFSTTDNIIKMGKHQGNTKQLLMTCETMANS